MGALLNLVPFYYRWIALGFLLAAIYGTGFYRGGIGPREQRDAAVARFDAFQAQVKAIGVEAQKAQAKDAADRKAISDRKEADNAKRYANLDARYRAAIARVRQSASAGSGEVQPLSSAATVLSCPDRSADVAERLAVLETGILALIERGDKAIERTITCKGWITEQIARNPQ